MIVRAACLALSLLCASPAAAQRVDESPPVPPGASVEFLPRFAVHVAASHLVSDDERYVWDAEYVGEIDLVDYVTGRASLYATYHVVLGEQFQLFDPNQGNYILGARASGRFGGTEVAGVFYHQSRHLGDRLRSFAVDWNMLGVRVSHPFTVRGASMEPIVDLRGVVHRSSVDYRWEVDARVRGRYPLRGRVALISDVGLRRLGVDGSRNRGTQTGARGEAGVRVEGRSAAVELFVAAERRIDPFPLEFGTETWMSAGFRLVSR